MPGKKEERWGKESKNSKSKHLAVKKLNVSPTLGPLSHVPPGLCESDRGPEEGRALPWLGTGNCGAVQLISFRLLEHGQGLLANNWFDFVIILEGE